MKYFLTLSIFILCSCSSTTELNPAHKEIVDESLEFLASTQKEDGHFSSLPGEPRSLLASHGRMKLVLTSVSGLAFLAGGSTAERGRYAKNVNGCVKFLKSLLMKDGKFALAEYEKGIYKSHIAQEVPFMICFFAELYKKNKDPQLKKLMQLTADYIANAQHKKEGGWDYSYVHKRKLHTVTTIWNLAALGIMKNLGVSVPDSTIEKGFAYIKRKHINPYNNPGYFQYGNVSPETGITNRASGMLWALEVNDLKESELWKQSLIFYRKSMHLEFIYGGHSPAYQNFMCAVAARRLGEADWKIYQERMNKSILSRRKGKYWPVANGKNDKVHPHGGAVFETALMSVILQLPLENLQIISE